MATRRERLVRDPYAEIWVTHGRFTAMCALVSGDAGWLMFLRYDGDAGFSTRNPAYRGAGSADSPLGSDRRLRRVEVTRIGFSRGAAP